MLDKNTLLQSTSNIFREIQFISVIDQYLSFFFLLQLFLSCTSFPFSSPSLRDGLISEVFVLILTSKKHIKLRFSEINYRNIKTILPYIFQIIVYIKLLISIELNQSYLFYSLLKYLAKEKNPNSNISKILRNKK